MSPILFAALLACAETETADAPVAADPAPQAERNAGPPAPVAPPTDLLVTSLADGCQPDGDALVCPGPDGYSLRRSGEALAQELQLVDSAGMVLSDLTCGDTGFRIFGQDASWRTMDGQPFALIVRCTWGQVGDAGMQPEGDTILVRGLRGYESLSEEVDARAVERPEIEAARLADAATERR